MKYKQFITRPVYIEILKYLKKKKTLNITEIAYQLDINYSYCHLRLKDLFKMGLIKIDVSGREKKISFSDKANMILDYVKKIEEIINEDDKIDNSKVKIINEDDKIDNSKVKIIRNKRR